MKNFAVIGFISIVTAWLKYLALKGKAKRKVNGWIFSPVPAFLLIWSAVFALGIGGILSGFIGPVPDRIVNFVCGVLFLAFTLLCRPKPIELDEIGLRQRDWLGRWKKLSWEEVSFVEVKKNGDISVNQQINFWSVYADSRLFLAKIKEHAPKYVEFARPTE
jgi:hypothetical protein